ncbi:MAG: hypothetical protein E7491_06735 [Ruminococcaceae bacterium]|nr:hypothetical protein [Oscillospiraceae bacterium]
MYSEEYKNKGSRIWLFLSAAAGLILMMALRMANIQHYLVLYEIAAILATAIAMAAAVRYADGSFVYVLTGDRLFVMIRTGSREKTAVELKYSSIVAVCEKADASFDCKGKYFTRDRDEKTHRDICFAQKNKRGFVTIAPSEQFLQRLQAELEREAE